MIQLQEHKNGRKYQIEKFTEKQAFHINIEETDLQTVLETYFGAEFMQLDAWSLEYQYQAKITGKGKLLSNRHRNQNSAQIQQGNNKQKKYCIPEGTVIPPLVDMGIFTKDGKVVRSRYDKYRQINRYLELVEDALKVLPEEHLNIIDFGCGKSYLTFLLYYYLVEVKKLDVTITGLDLKKDVIAHCQETARRYQYKHLNFQVGDIAAYQSKEPVHMVITLHACDTATDYAMYHAVQWDAKVILSVPCCQHELNQQMQDKELPILSRYGILKERSAAIMTDAIRANLLEYSGYKTQVLEFIDLEHSPKNLLIRAVKTKTGQAGKKTERQKQALAEVEALMQTFGLHPTLYKLLVEQNMQERHAGL
jgi:SAM-dependent methyltransferase